MSDTGGTIISLSELERNEMSSGFVSLIYFLFGLVTTCMMKTLLSNISISAEIMGVPDESAGNFISAIVTIVAIFYIFGSVVAFLFVPTNRICSNILIWIIASGCYMQLAIIIFVPYPMAKHLFVFSSSVLASSCGIVNMIAIGTATDYQLQGTVNKRLVLLFSGHAGGFLLSSIVTYLMEYELNDVQEVDTALCVIGWGIPSMSIVISVILITVHSIIYSRTATKSQLIRERMDIFNSLQKYSTTFNALGNCSLVIASVCFVQAMESFFNVGSGLLKYILSVINIVICAIDPFPQIEDPIISLFTVTIMCASDLMGRLTVHLINVYRDAHGNSGNYGSSNNSLMAMMLLWIPLLFLRLPYGITALLERHYPDSYYFDMTAKLHLVILMSCFNRFIRGLLISTSYDALFNTAYYGTLKFYKLPKVIPENEPLECMDKRVSSVETASLIVSWVHILEILTGAIFIYIGYKYQQVIYAVEDQYIITESWPTDHLYTTVQKFMWWIKEMMLMIWRDVKTPFCVEL